MRWLKANTDASVVTLLRDGGDLTLDFEALGPVLFWNKRPGPQANQQPVRASERKGILGRIDKRFRRMGLKARLERERIDLIYSNTVSNSDTLAFLADTGCPVITHVHDLEHSIRCYVGEKNFNLICKYSRHYIAVSCAVRDNLVENHRIPENRVSVVYGFVPSSAPQPACQIDSRDRIRAKLDIPPEALVVAAAGSLNWWKAPEMFVHLARTAHRKQPGKVYFLWVGGKAEGPEFGGIQNDIHKSGLSRFVRFTGSLPNPLDYFLASDIFALVSREDSFPLVVLEAASVGKPVLCFDGAGGAVEFVEDDCGFIVPYMDIEAMADQIIRLADSQNLRHSLGQRAVAKVSERHTADRVAPRLYEIIREIAGR
ncbi:MAG: glycosyltransferase family 4 protein [Armatimonadetes bacterium]|nr:glycosyltransferase family 4 protein [Armatimonadota bacterium]